MMYYKIIETGWMDATEDQMTVCLLQAAFSLRSALFVLFAPPNNFLKLSDLLLTRLFRLESFRSIMFSQLAHYFTSMGLCADLPK